MVEAKRGDRYDGDAFFIDQERILVGSVGRAPILDDAQPSSRKIVDDAMVEQYNAVGHVLLDAVPREASFAPLGGDNSRQLAVLEPIEEPPHLRADDGFIGNAGEQRVDG